MIITGLLVDMILEMDSETYINHVVLENGKKVIYVFMLREIYGMLVVALLFYKKRFGDLKRIVFDCNPYYPCVTNRISVGNQHTVRLHMENIASIHVNPRVNYKFKKWMNHNYVKHGAVKENIGKLH